MTQRMVRLCLVRIQLTAPWITLSLRRGTEELKCHPSSAKSTDQKTYLETNDKSLTFFCGLQ